MRTFKLKKCNRIHGVHFMPGGRLLVVGGYEAEGINDIAWFDLAAGALERRQEHLAGTYAISNDRRRIVLTTEAYDSADAKRLLQFCDPRADSDEWRILPTGSKWARHTSAMTVDGLAFTPDGDRLHVGIGQQVIRPGQVEVRWTHRVVVCSFDPPKMDSALDVDEPFGVRAVSPDGERLATTGGPNGEPTVALYTRADRPPIATFDPPQTRTHRLAYSPDGRRIAIANGQKAFLLTADELKPTAELAGHARQVNALAFTPDGKQLMTVGHDGAIRTWSVADGRPLKSFDWKIGPVTAVDVAADGLMAAVAGKSGQVVVWDLED